MKTPYQIDRGRAVKRFEDLAQGEGAAVQLALPMIEIVAAMRSGLGEMIRQAGLQLFSLIMEEEVAHVVGKRHEQQPERAAYRWGKEAGYCIIDGQKVPIQRCRVRNKQGQEVQLGSYEMAQRDGEMEGKIWLDLMRGLSTRNYSQTVRRFANAYGIEKSAVSEQFIQASRTKLKQLQERRLEDVKLCALMIDGTPYHGQQFIVALGVGQDGRKMVLGVRQGATENATVVGGLLEDLAERGLDFTQRCLFVLDGAKALHSAVKKHAGEDAAIQRCQLHKCRNVVGHLAEEHQPSIERKLKAAWSTFDYAEAKRALERVHRELMELNPSAAHSLAEGMDETLTIHRLAVPEALRKTLFSTNPIESVMSVVEEKCRRVKKWRDGDMGLRWVTSGMLFAESKFRRVKGYKEIPKLVSALQEFGKKSLAKAAKAS